MAGDVVNETPFEVATDETMSVCPRCGAMVGNEDRHREWHQQVGTVLEAIRITLGG